jgi:hypothetical protein
MVAKYMAVMVVSVYIQDVKVKLLAEMILLAGGGEAGDVCLEVCNAYVRAVIFFSNKRTL